MKCAACLDTRVCFNFAELHADQDMRCFVDYFQELETQHIRLENLTALLICRLHHQHLALLMYKVNYMVCIYHLVVAHLSRNCAVG